MSFIENKLSSDGCEDERRQNRWQQRQIVDRVQSGHMLTIKYQHLAENAKCAHSERLGCYALAQSV